MTTFKPAPPVYRRDSIRTRLLEAFEMTKPMWLSRTGLHHVVSNNIDARDLHKVLTRLHADGIIEGRRRRPAGGIGRDIEEYRLARR